MSEHNDVCPDCGGDVSPVTGALKNALDAEREAKRKAERQLKAAKDASAGIDKEKYRQMTEASEKKDARITELEQSLDAMTKQREADAKKFEEQREADAIELGKAQEAAAEAEALRAENAQLKEAAVTDSMRAAIAKNGGDPDLLIPHARAIKGEQPDIEKDALVSELRERFPSGFKASEQSGGGAPVGDSGGTRSIMETKSNGTLHRSKMSDAEKNAFQKEHGLDALLELPL
jgi:hypothetical protein